MSDTFRNSRAGGRSRQSSAADRIMAVQNAGIREPGQEEGAPEEDGAGAGEEEEVRDRIWQRSS